MNNINDVVDEIASYRIPTYPLSKDYINYKKHIKKVIEEYVSALSESDSPLPQESIDHLHRNFQKIN